MRISERIKSVHITSVAPFTNDGALDLESADSLVGLYLGRGVDGMTLLGVMGKAA